MKKFLPSVLIVLSSWLGLAAQAQTWPTKPVRVVVPYPAGGSADAIARHLAQAVGGTLGQPVIIDNRPGAGAAIGAEHVARAPADGYTLLLGSPNFHALGPAIMTLRFDPLRELPGLGGVARSEMVFVTGTKHRGQTLQAWIAAARAKDGKTNVGAVGTGSSNHLVGELLKRTANVTAQHVPYAGAAPLAVAVMSGEVDMAVLDVGAVLPHVMAGNMVALAVASTRRSEFLPEVPTTAESGFPQLVAENVYGLFQPVGVPADVQARLAAAVRQALATDALREQYRKAGLVPFATTGAELDTQVKASTDQFVPLVRDLKIRID